MPRYDEGRGELPGAASTTSAAPVMPSTAALVRDLDALDTVMRALRLAVRQADESFEDDTFSRQTIAERLRDVASLAVRRWEELTALQDARGVGSPGRETTSDLTRILRNLREAEKRVDAHLALSEQDAEGTRAAARQLSRAAWGITRYFSVALDSEPEPED